VNTPQSVVKIFARELMYLRNMNFLPEDLLQIINASCSIDKGAFTLSLSHEMTERFRSIFTERLAKVGFDENYGLTNEGSILEELIDRFQRTGLGSLPARE
jgi:hypothetical protein